ncbi:MAG: 5-deoxy-glucuronate isomerase [Meiothermus sp.]|uniref:5-deoxy-glucuronate isomerase n=1 Tax=Meiothermus sp. TaxID=1955249 RepID=UPI00298F3C9F|nr:5-deoxy-glucuronate isomerase [Meiothermus sp.]MDW8481583.1 5-deoxy-glucuronate isomerase [Meiothermus sp.]
MRYFHTIPQGPGFQSLADEACKLLAFAKLNLEAGQSYTGQTGEHEVLLVALSGTAEVEVGGRVFARAGGRPNVFAGNPHSVYLPKGRLYTVRAHTRFEAALPSALRRPSRPSPTRIRPEQVNTGKWGTLELYRPLPRDPG